MFNEMVTSKLDYYVYALVDPTQSGALKDKVFYIGKGKDNRAFNHAKAERKKGEEPLKQEEHKLKVIRNIRERGKDVEVIIVRHGLDEKEALATESVLIHLLGATNKVAGHESDRLWLEKNAVLQLYDDPIERSEHDELKGCILLVSLNQQPNSSLLKPRNKNALKKVTLGNWNLSEEKSRVVDYVIGVKNKLVVSIYRVDKGSNGLSRFKRLPSETRGGHTRSRFFGHEVPELESAYVGRSIMQGDDTVSKIRPRAGCQFLEAIC